MPVTVSIEINGEIKTERIKENLLLVDFIRDSLRLTGTHIGCDTAQCGACTIHLNKKAIKSCNLLAIQADGCQILTIEGLATSGDKMHPMQKAFRDHHGLQCGFCTPGMIMSALNLIENNKALNDTTIREGLEGNLCRCTGYHNIIKAVKSGSDAMKEKKN
tara:strand:- start:563 stop:1045 length:483 start_codon:yes stop_codon:yes gene_type:complete